MEAAGSSETLEAIYETTWLHTSEDTILKLHRHHLNLLLSDIVSS